MKVSCSRLKRMLKENGFVVGGSTSFADSCIFARNDECPMLYQHILATHLGRHHEVVAAYVDVSVTKWVRAKGLTESRVLREIAQDQERCWTKIRSPDEAKAWEVLLVRVGPTKAAELAIELGSTLLEKTRDSRAAAQESLSRLDPAAGVAAEIERLRGLVSPAAASEAQRITARLGVIPLRGSRYVYQLSCLAVLHGDIGDYSPGKDPLLNEQLMWQIDLVADGILSWDENSLIREGKGGRPR